MKVSIKFRKWSPQYLKSCQVPRPKMTAPSPSQARLQSPRGPQRACRGVTTPGPHMVSPWGLGRRAAEAVLGDSWPACGNGAPVHTSVPRENSGAEGPRAWSVPDWACSCPVTFLQEPFTCSLPAAPLGPSPVSSTCSQLTAGDQIISLSSFVYKHLPPGRCREKADVGTGAVVPLENHGNHQAVVGVLSPTVFVDSDGPAPASARPASLQGCWHRGPGWICNLAKKENDLCQLI